MVAGDLNTSAAPNGLAALIYRVTPMMRSHAVRDADCAYKRRLTCTHHQHSERDVTTVCVRLSAEQPMSALRSDAARRTIYGMFAPNDLMRH